MKRIKKSLFVVLTIVIAFSFTSIGVFAEDSAHVHTWSDWTETTTPTCGESGEMERYCMDCYVKESKTVAPTGDHYWSDWEVVKKATVFKQGKKKRSCYYCDKTQTKAIAKIKPFAKFKKKVYKLKKGKKLSLKKKLKFARGDKVKKWKSSNKRIATVNSKGKVKAKRAGKVKITAKMKSGKKATCKIKVTKPKKKRSRSYSRSSGSSGVSGVYWVDSGYVYHSTSNCPTLSRSKNIHYGTAPAGRRPCKVCY